MRIGGVILAAGASRRMGSPKALLEIGGETFLDRLIGAFRPYCTPVVVVLGHHAEIIRSGAKRLREAEVVVNSLPERGQLSSLQCGLRALPPECDAVMFTPVDYPRVLSSTIGVLAQAMDAEIGKDDEPPSVFVPTHKGRHGHPVGARRELIAELLHLPEDATTREVIHRHGNRTRYIEVGDPGILCDIDDPETYKKELALDARK
jgi:molybdenum cofactor cytidylyltransferase